MPTVKFIVGLCGSGKSHHAESLQRNEGFLVLDEKYPYDPDRPFENDTQKFEELVKRLSEGKDCAYTDFRFMFEHERRLFQSSIERLNAMPGVRVDWVYFENDLEAANHNCRNDPQAKRTSDVQGFINLNNKWSIQYEVPDGHTPHKIFRLPGLEGRSS